MSLERNKISQIRKLLKTTDILQEEGMKIVYCGPQTRKTSSVIFTHQHYIFKPPLLKWPRSVAPENFMNGKGYQYLTDTPHPLRGHLSPTNVSGYGLRGAEVYSD